MNILYVADNRYKRNWGCRGTGTSLYQLLSGQFEIGATMSGKIVAQPISIGTLMPPALDDLLWSVLPDYKRVSQQFAPMVDYVSEDPRQSVANLRKYRSRYPKLDKIYKQVEACDAIIINGEGDMVFTTPPRRRLLFLFMIMELARQMGKPYAIVNAMVSDSPVFGHNDRTAATTAEYLGDAAFVALRDHTSVTNAQALAPQANIQHFPDALFSWQRYYDPPVVPANGDYLLPWTEDNADFGKLDFSEPYICVSGSSSPLLNDTEQAAKAFTGLVEALKPLGLRIYIVKTSDDAFWEAVMGATGVAAVPSTVPIVSGGAILANARLLVSGRYHPSIFASLGGTPSSFSDRIRTKHAACKICLNTPTRLNSRHCRERKITRRLQHEHSSCSTRGKPGGTRFARRRKHGRLKSNNYRKLLVTPWRHYERSCHHPGTGWLERHPAQEYSPRGREAAAGL